MVRLNQETSKSINFVSKLKKLWMIIKLFHQCFLQLLFWNQPFIRCKQLNLIFQNIKLSKTRRRQNSESMHLKINLMRQRRRFKWKNNKWSNGKIKRSRLKGILSKWNSNILNPTLERRIKVLIKVWKSNSKIKIRCLSLIIELKNFKTRIWILNDYFQLTSNKKLHD